MLCVCRFYGFENNEGYPNILLYTEGNWETGPLINYWKWPPELTLFTGYDDLKKGAAKGLCWRGSNFYC